MRVFGWLLNVSGAILYGVLPAETLFVDIEAIRAGAKC